MELNLKGKVAYITGAGMGIAKAIALNLAKEGVDIAFMEIAEKPLGESRKEIESLGVRVIAYPGSVTELEDVKASVGATIASLGKIDILVNSAGSSPGGDVLPISHEDWAQAFDVKFLGYVRCIKEVVPHMIRQGGGKIINVIGVGATEFVPLHVSGAANNAAAVVLTSYFAQEVGKHNIQVIGINPGMVGPTIKLAKLISAIAKERGCTERDVEQEMVDRTPLGRFCHVDDIADLAVFLASDANKFITGEVITIDGGYTKAIMNG
jgi:3-oxoacyl-[acyl-carrier protein] reductase